MKRVFFILLLLPTMAFCQLGKTEAQLIAKNGMPDTILYSSMNTKVFRFSEKHLNQKNKVYWQTTDCYLSSDGKCTLFIIHMPKTEEQMLLSKLDSMYFKLSDSNWQNPKGNVFVSLFTDKNDAQFSFTSEK